MRWRNIAAAMAVLAAADPGITIDPWVLTHRRTNRSDAVRNFAALWIREHMDGCVVSVSRRRRVKGVE